MKLRDGSTVRDPRLGRLIKHDPRSTDFLIAKSAALVGQSPRSYTWRCTTWLDQGQEGSCVGHGVAHELAARPAEVQGMTHAFARTRIYFEAQKIDEWPGGAYPGASPFYEGTSVTAGVKVAQKLGAMKSYRWAYSLDDLVLGLGYAGPAVLGIYWWTGMFDPDATGFIHRTGQIEGGHCLLALAVNVKAQKILLHNSWGKDWGVDGRAWISYADMQKLLADDGEACFFLDRSTTLKV